MTARRDRPSQVRPRPPSSGASRRLPPPRRPSGVGHPVRATTPKPARRIPLAAQLALGVAVVALAVVVFSTVTGSLPRMVGAIGSAFGGVTDAILTTPTPQETAPAILPAPALEAPESPYTNTATVSLRGTVPPEVVGRGDEYVIRIYVAQPDAVPQDVLDVPVGQTAAFVVNDLPLEKGRNDVTAALVGPGGESEPSAVVTYVLDTSKPKITVTSPKDNARVNGATVKLVGKTQGRATVVARNETNGTAATAVAENDGAFTLTVPMSSGANAISLTATDLAGNVGTASLSVRRGAGKLTVALSSSAYQVSAAKLPRSVELRAVVTDPNGRPMAGETVSFTLSIPGVPALTGEDTTDASGVATFKSTIPKGATKGSGLATAFVSTADHGDASGRTSITIVK